MILLSTIINQFEKSFFTCYRNSLLPGHKKALSAMKRCRTEYSSYMLAQCTDDECDELLYIPHSCGHRSCPHCQNHENWQWIENQLNKRLPAEYYLITFTLPRQLRNLAWKHQRTVFSLMFTAVQELLKTFTLNDKRLKGAAGFTAILHTHSRTLDFHPHIHVVMPAASINRKTGIWRTKSSGFLFSHKAMAKVFRAKLLQAIVENNLSVPGNCPEQWVVDCKNVGNGDKALIYLGKYLYKGVIQEKDIVRCKDGKITFRYIDSKTKQQKTRTVSGEYFLYMLMSHVLPRGFRKTRCYGFLHPCSKRIIRFLQLILRIKPHRMLKKMKKRATITCPKCGAEMRITKTMLGRPAASRRPVLPVLDGGLVM